MGGSSFFAVRRDSDPSEGSEHILALNKHGVHFLDLITHETILHYPFTEVISTRQMETDDGVLFLDMKCGNLMQQRISRIQTDQAVHHHRSKIQGTCSRAWCEQISVQTRNVKISRNFIFYYVDYFAVYGFYC